MRQVFLEKGALVVQQVAQPQLDENIVLISVHYSFISSGTEAASISTAQRSALFSNVPQKIKSVLASLTHHGIEGTAALIKSKLKGTVQALGYSCSGRVIAVGKKVTKFRPGDYVACAGAGWASHADVVCVPENLVVSVGDEKLLKHASITTIGAIALQGIRRAQVQLGETVCVIGLGLLGQLTVQLAKQSGAEVIGIDLVPERLALARELGADHTFLASDEHRLKNIEYLTQHKGVDVTLITAATSSNEVIQDAMTVTRKKGKVVIVGDVGLNLQRNPFYKKEIDLLISCSYGPGRYDHTYEIEGKDYPFEYVRWTENRNMQTIVQMIKSGTLSIDTIVSHEFNVDQVDKAYELLKEKKALGVILSYLPKQDISFVPAIRHAPFHSHEVTFKPAVKDSPIRVGFVGVGGFAQVKLLPIVNRLSGVKLTAVADANITQAENTSRTYGLGSAFTQSNDMVEKDLVDAVVIATPHVYHAQQALDALYKGKAVFLEKPMATTFEQNEKYKEFFKYNPHAPFCVDYNRSFAPFIQKIKWEVVKRATPLLIHYRMNAGYIASDHWTQTAIGAGRLIGEACHIFDLFCFLTGSKPTAVSVEALKPVSDNLFPTDNFSVQISFQDGSICTLLYTALGHTALGKERMEVFVDGKSMVMDDYKVLRGYGTTPGFDETTSSPDKGHEILMRKFFTSLRDEQKPMPISIDRLLEVSHLTLVIDQLACQGGGSKEL